MVEKSLVIVAVYAKDSIGAVLYMDAIPSVMAKLLLNQILPALLSFTQLCSLAQILSGHLTLR